MHFELDPRAPASPSRQLADQVRFAVASGRLAPRDQLPSVRQLAAQVRVNPNTVSRTWAELEREGILERRRGKGMFVTEDAQSRARLACAPLLRERLERAVQEALAAGWQPDELRDALEQLLHDARSASTSNSQDESAA